MTRTTAMSGTEAGLRAAVDARPEDDVARGALADYYDELADVPGFRDRACAQRLAMALRAVLADPADDEPRLRYAGVLEQYAGEVECRRCEGGRRKLKCGKWNPRMGPPDLPRAGGIPRCDGSGRVPDGRRDRAEFIRVQCELARAHPGCHCKGCRPSERHGPVLCRAPLRERERELFERHGAAWFGPTACLTPPSEREQRSGSEWRIVRRGFIAEVRAPLAALFGGPCERCDGRGLMCPADLETVTGHFDPAGYDEDDCAGCGASKAEHLTCPDCSGTGATPGAAAGLWASQPTITRAVLTDRVPRESTRGGKPLFWWVKGTKHGSPAELADAAVIPGCLWETGFLGEHGQFDSRQAALGALSAAACALGRKRAGLAGRADPGGSP